MLAGVVDGCSRGYVIADAAGLVADRCFEGGDVTVQVGEKVGGQFMRDELCRQRRGIRGKGARRVERKSSRWLGVADETFL